MSARIPSTAGRVALVVLLLAGLLAGMELLATTPAWADSCPNAAERFGASANLPDCRAYELVTPPVKEDNSNLFNVFGYADGEHVIMNSLAPFPGAQSGALSPTLSSRTPTGWVTKDLTPRQGPGESDTLSTDDQGNSLFSGALTSDSSTAFVDSTFASDPLDQNQAHDVYRINVATGASAVESLPDAGPITESLYHAPGLNAAVPGSTLSGISADGSRVYFTTVAKLTTAPGTPAETQQVGLGLYERHAGHTYIVGVLPNGTVPNCGAELGEGGANALEYYQRYIYGAISPDGSNVVFRTPSLHFGGETPGCGPNELLEPGEESGLFLREDNGTPQAKTVELSGDLYLGRSEDGLEVFSGGSGSIYEYDIATGKATTIGVGNLLAYSADGSVVYYLAHPGEEAEQQIMVYDHGVTKTVPNAGAGYAGKSLSDSQNNLLGFQSLENLPVTTPDGSKLIFVDRANLTSFDSAGPQCAGLNKNYKGNVYLVQNCDEAYIYDLTNGSFTCVSCDPNGTPPSTGTELFIPPGFNTQVSQTTFSLSEGGSRAFFETGNSLVPQDTNGQTDVYEWENGHIYLISSGQGTAGSRLDGVSRDGDNVIFQTSDDLLPQDIESSTQVYDARVEGGFPYTTPVYGCDSGQCQGPQTPAPVFAPPASATFAGVGNPPQTSQLISQPKQAAKPKHKAKKAKPKPKRGGGKAKGQRRNRDGKGKK